jgi:hypothetical protein
LSSIGLKADIPTRSYTHVTERLKSQKVDGPGKSNPPTRSAKNRFADFLPHDKPKMNSANNTRKADRDRMNKAKKLPVKPTLRVKGTKDLDSLWIAIKAVLDKPRVDSVKKLPSGDILVVSTDEETVRAIKDINGNDGLNVIESGHTVGLYSGVHSELNYGSKP